MKVPIHGYDWGRRSARWQGIHSRVVDVAGTRAHLLQRDADAVAPPEASAAAEAITHLLVHPMGAGSWFWLDVIAPLAAHGPVVAVDLAGSGRTRPRDARDARAEESAGFLLELLDALALDRAVVHGHSMGGLVAVLLAARAPARVAGLVLAAAPVPGAADSAAQQAAYRTVGRAALRIAEPLGRVLMRAGLRLKTDAWERWLTDPADPRLEQRLSASGTNLARVSPELRAVLREELRRYRRPWRADGAVAAALSVVEALTVAQDATLAAVDRVTAPTLVLWGEADRVIPGVLGEQLAARRPDWEQRTVPDAGHLIPWEAPDAYVSAVADWLART